MSIISLYAMHINTPHCQALQYIAMCFFSRVLGRLKQQVWINTDRMLTRGKRKPEWDSGEANETQNMCGDSWHIYYAFVICMYIFPFVSSLYINYILLYMPISVTASDVRSVLCYLHNRALPLHGRTRSFVRDNSCDSKKRSMVWNGHEWPTVVQSASPKPSSNSQGLPKVKHQLPSRMTNIKHIKRSSTRT